MKVLYNLQRQILKPKVMIVVWLIIALVCAILKYNIDAYNNFSIFSGVAHHLFSEQPLYDFYPEQYFDRNHYGPFFAFIIAPFAYLPTWLGLPLWLVSMTAALCWAVYKLPIEDKWKSVILILSANDLVCASMMQQFNIGLAAILLGSFVLIEKHKEKWAALLIVLGIFSKIYGVVGLALFFFVKDKKEFILYGVLWSMIALVAPLLFVSPEFLIQQYQEWFSALAYKSELNMTAIDQNISLNGVFRKISCNYNYSDLLIMVPAMLLFCGVYLRWRCFKDTTFRMLLISAAMIFVVIFSSGSETSGYIIASIGSSIWWVTLKKRGAFEWILLTLLLVSSFALNIFPSSFYDAIWVKYALRALPMTFIWLYIMYELYTRDFHKTAPHQARI